MAGRLLAAVLVVAMERLEGRALYPKRAADKPSFARSHWLLAEGPQAPRAEHLWRLALAARLAIQRDLGVQNLCDVPAQQIEAPLVGVLECRYGVKGARSAHRGRLAR